MAAALDPVSATLLKGISREKAGGAIITGSDSGIGRASAVALAADGFDVGITWHADADGAEKTATEAKNHGVRADVRQLVPARRSSQTAASC